MQRTSNHFILNVQYCKSCDTHNWCTHHDEQKYLNTYQKLKHHLQKLFGKDIYVQGNVIPSQLVPIKPAQNKYFNSKTNKYVTFPAIGAFQISFGNQILFSKKKTNNWPNFTEVADKVYFKLNGKQRSPQQKQNSIANVQERIHSADVDVKTEKDNLSVKNQSFLDHNDKRSTFYKSKPNQQKNFTLTDHFRNYHNADYKNPIDVKRNSDDFFTTNPTDNQNQLSEVSSFRNNNSSERDFLEFKRNFESGLSEHGVKLSELIKKKGYMKEDLGKKQMIIRLDSIQEESLLVDENASFNYGQNVNLTNTHSTFKSKSQDSHQKLMKRFNDDFQQLQAKFKKFEQKVQTIREENKKFDHHNKDFQMGKINEKLMKEINDYKKKQKKLRNSQMNQLDLEDLQGEQGMMDNPIVFARRKLKSIEDYINGTEEEKNQKLKKIYGEWKLLKKPYKGKCYVSPYKIEVKKRNTEDKIQPQFKNSNELNDYTSSSSSNSQSQQIHSKNTDLHSSNQKLPQMQNMKMKSPQNKQVLTQQKFYSTARDKFNEIGNRKLKKDKKLNPHSHSATLNQFHRASDGVKLNTFDHYQQAAQKSDEFLSVNSNEIQPRTFYSNQKSYNKGRKLRSIPKNGQKQNFLTNQTSSRGRQLSRSSSNINEERMINQVINSKKAKLNSQIGSGHSNASASKSKNFRSKKKQNYSKSKSKDNSPFKQKVINLMEDQQCDINGSSSVSSDEQNLVQDSQEHSQSLNNNFLEKDAKSKFSNQKPSQARKLKNYEKDIGENKQWKQKDEESVKVNKVKKNLKNKQTNGNQQTEQRSSRYLTSQKKNREQQKGSQGQIVTSYHKLEKKSKNQVLKQLQKQKKFQKDKLNTEDNQVPDKYKKRSKQQKIMKIENNSQDEDYIHQYPFSQAQNIQKETKTQKNRKQTKDKPLKGKQKAKQTNKQTSEEQGSNQSENYVAEFSENQGEPQGKNKEKRELKLKQQNTKKINKTTKKQTQRSKQIESQQQPEFEKSETDETQEKDNNRVKAGKSKQKENLIKKKSKIQDNCIKDKNSQSDEQELVSNGKNNNTTGKNTLARKNKQLSNKKQDSNQNELKKKKISPNIKQEELDQAKGEDQSRSCEQQQERFRPVKTDKKEIKTKRAENQTDKNLNKNLKKKSNKTKLQQSQEREDNDESCNAEQNSQSQGQSSQQSEKSQQNRQFIKEQGQLNIKQKKEMNKSSKKGVKTSNKKSNKTKGNKSKNGQNHQEDQLGSSSNSVQSNNSQTSANENAQSQNTNQAIVNSNYSHNKKSKNPDQITKNKKQHSKKQRKEKKVNRSLGKNGTDDQVSEQEQSNQLLQEHSEQDKIQQSDECIEVDHQGSEIQQLLKSSKSKQSKSKIKSIKQSSLKSNRKKPTEQKKKDIRQKSKINQASNSQIHSEQQQQSNIISKNQNKSSLSKNNKKNNKQKSKQQKSEIFSEQEEQQHIEQSESQADEKISQSQQTQNQKTKVNAHNKGLKATKIREKSQQLKKQSQILNENIKTSKTNANKNSKDKTNNKSIQSEQEQISQGFQSKPKTKHIKSKGKGLVERQEQQHSQTEQQEEQISEPQRSAAESLQSQNEELYKSSQKVNQSKSHLSKSKKLNNQTKQAQQNSSTINKSNRTKLKEKQSKQTGKCEKRQKKNPKLQRSDQIDQGQTLNEDTQNQSEDQQTSQLNQQPAQNLSDQSQKESQEQNEQASVRKQKQKLKLAKKNLIRQKNSKKSSKQKAKAQTSQQGNLSQSNQEAQEKNERQSETEKYQQSENETQKTPQNGNVNQISQNKSADKSKKNNNAKNSLQKSNNSSIQTKEKEQQQEQQEEQNQLEQEESQQQLSQGQQNQHKKKSKKTKVEAKANKKNKANSTIPPQQQQSHPIQSTLIQQNNLQQQQPNQVVENSLQPQKSKEKLSQNLQEAKDIDLQKSQEKKQLQIRLNTARTNKTSRKNKILNVYHTSRDPHCEDQQQQSENQDNQKVAQVQGQKANSDHQDKVGTQSGPLSNNKDRSMVKKRSIDAGTQVNTSHIIQHNENARQINQNPSISKQQQNIQPQHKFQATQQQNTPQLALQTRQLQPQLDLSLEDRQDQILPIESSMNGNQNDIRQGKCQGQFSNENNNAGFNSSAIRSSQKQEESLYPQQSINSSPKNNNSGKVTRAPITKQFMGQGFNLELQKYPLLLKNPHLHHKHMLSDLSADNPQSSIIGRLPQNIITQSPILFSPKSLQLQKLHSNHPLPNLMKCLKILCDINEFLIIRLFQNPSMKFDPDNVLDKIFGVWLCVNYEWKCLTVDLNQILLSNPTLPYYLNHSKNQLWPYILQLALVKALNGYKTLLSTPCHKLFTLMTGSNSLFFNIKEDPTKNSRILRYISDCQNKNFVLHAQKVEKTLEELQKKDKQNRIYYVLSQKIVNDGQVLLQIKESTSEQSRWIRLNKFVQQFKSIQILQLRLNHNFTSFPIPRPSNTSNLTILQLQFLQQSFGSITLSTQSGSSTPIMKTLLYREQKSNMLKLVGQAKEKNKSILFFDCYFGQNTKYYLFVQTKQDTRVTYLGQNQPLIRIVEEINSQGLKNDYTQYLPVKNIHSSNTNTVRFQKQNAAFFKQKAPQKLTKSKFGQTGMSFKSQQDKISRLRQNFVQYLLKGKD